MDTFFCMPFPLASNARCRLLILASVYRDASETEKRFVRTGDFFIFTVFVGAIIVVSTRNFLLAL